MYWGYCGIQNCWPVWYGTAINTIGTIGGSLLDFLVGIGIEIDSASVALRDYGLIYELY
jgi:uncharacterized membrane protein YdjX (TVP38/TMEM64 family)